MTSRGPPMTFMLLMMGAASGAQALAASPSAVIPMHPHLCRWYSEGVVCRARGGPHSELTHTGSGHWCWLGTRCRRHNPHNSRSISTVFRGFLL
jgi:hypothetical protein